MLLLVVFFGSREFFDVSFRSNQLLMLRNFIAARALPNNLILIPSSNLGLARSCAHLIVNSHCSRKMSSSSWFAPLKVGGSNLSAAFSPIVSTVLSEMVNESRGGGCRRSRILLPSVEVLVPVS